MPSGSAVIPYKGKRGTVWRIKYRDASGTQVQETLGPEKGGWSRTRAKAELRHRLSDVEREGMRRAAPLTFQAFAEPWLTDYAALKTLKRSTVDSYKTILNVHLLPTFGRLKVDTIGVAHIEAHAAKKMRGGLEAGTLNRQLNLLSLILKGAVRAGLLKTNPVSSVERPREPRRRWAILTPAEINATEAAFRELVTEAVGTPEAVWNEQARVAFKTVYGLGLRRGEILGLRWRCVMLADPDGPKLRVAETWVRDASDTPKSEAGERTIALAPRIASELFDHRARTAYGADTDFVFANPTMGGVLDHKRYAQTFQAALKRAGVEKQVRPFHDGRHTSITNAAAAGVSPAALQAQAGHSSYSVTQRYVDLAGVTFRAEADLAEARLYGEKAEA